VDGEQVGWTKERFDGYPCTPAEARDQRRSLLVDWLRAIAEDPQSGVGRMMVGSPGRSALNGHVVRSLTFVLPSLRASCRSWSGVIDA